MLSSTRPESPAPRSCEVALRVLLGFLASLLALTEGSSAELHVSPGGDDGATGGREAPFATVHRAQEAARGLVGREPVTVWLHRGVHYLERPLRLTQEDSGSEERPVVYRGLGDDVVLSGGRRLDLSWRPHAGAILVAETPPGVVFDQLFVDGERRDMARYPNHDPAVRPFGGYASDAVSRERAARWRDPAGGFLHVMHRHHWGGHHFRITGKDAAGDVVLEGGWQNNRQLGLHPEHRFVENILEELDAPGEWFHDVEEARLYYWPRPGEDMASARIEVAGLERLVEIVGTRERPVRHVTIRDLTFRHAARTFMKNREPLLRSDWTIHRGGALHIEGAERCRIERCFLDQLGGNAIFVDRYNRDVVISGCHIRDAGGNGIAFVGSPEAVRSPLFEYGQRQSLAEIDTEPGPRTDDYPSRCTVDDCLIVRTGRVEKQTAGVQISMSSHITVRRSSIYEVPRAGINIGEGTFGGHLIERCDVFDTVLETGDHGSFNSWGRDRFWGLTDAPAEMLPELARLDMVAPNVIRESRWRCDHGWDIDLDDGSSGYHIHDNLLLGGGLKLREGFHRVAENNVIVGNSLHPHVWYPNSGDVVRRNIVFTEYRPIRVPSPWGAEIDHNLLHREGRTGVVRASGLSRQSGRDEGSLEGDALFVDAASGDFRVREGSPATSLGFRNFPMDRFGVERPELRRIARSPEIPRPAPPPAPSQPRRAESRWLGATVRELEGEEYSAFGVGKEEGGVHLRLVPEGSLAAAQGSRTNDLIRRIGEHPVRALPDLHGALREAAGAPLRVELVRAQRTLTIVVERYTYFGLGRPSGPKLAEPPGDSGSVVAWRAIDSRPDTANEPLATLGDGRLARDYGPVFRNGIPEGRYRVDLGSERVIHALVAVSHDQNGNRGAQRFEVFGARGDSPPGWPSAASKDWEPIGAVDTVGIPRGPFQSTELRASRGELGRFRWLVWVVRPVTELGEHTAFQELRVLSPRP